MVRSITSTRQSINFYGEPRFLTDGQGTQLHGDARNEYGLLALNQYLGIGNAAFVVRANVNLNDSLDDIQNQWDAKSEDVSVVIQNTVQNYINNVNLANGITTDGASVLANLSNRIPASQNQTQAEFDGIAPFGSATVGQSATGAVNFAFGDVITFTNGMQIRIGLVDQHIGATSGTGEPTQFTVIAAGAQTTVDAATGNDIQWLGTPLVIESIVDSAGNDAAANSPTLHPNNTLTPRDGFSLTPQLANFDVFIQTHVDFPTFTGGMNYAVDDLVTMNNSAQVRVAAVDANGSITDFALVTQGNPVTVGTVNAIAANPANPTTPQTGFTFEVTADNLETRRTTVTNEELKTIVRDATSLIFDQEIGVFSFRTLEDDFFDIKSDSDTTLPSTFQVFPNGFDFAAGSDQFIGFDGEVENPTNIFPLVQGSWTAAEAADLFGDVASNFKFTIPFLNETSLGANDAARRVTISSSLQAEIVGNTDIRAENFQFSVVACPGYPEVIDELLALSADQQNEVLVVADTPADLKSEEITNPTNGWAATTARQNSTDVAYYYPWCLTANLDGANVLSAPSGVAIRQMAFNDNIAFLWFAPAGLTRGLVTGITDVGYARGVIGTSSTSFQPVALNQGQRDALYQDVPSGRINPIVFQPGRGIAIMGQKTSSPIVSALNRVNVVRLVMHVRRQLRLNTVGFLFEPNDQTTRDNVRALADNFLANIMLNRGIDDFLTVCDETNNTPDVIDRSELILDCLIRPIKSVEFISIPIRIVSQGAEI